MASYYDGVPSDVTILLELSAGVFTDVTDYVADRENLSITRYKPGQAGRFGFRLASPGGGISGQEIHEEMGVHVEDRSGDPSQPYPRYFSGRLKEVTWDVEGANEKIYDLVAYGGDNILKEPPYQLTTDYTVGYAPWQPGKPYEVGEVVQPLPTNSHKYVCATAGTSGSTQPVFNATGGSTTTEIPPTRANSTTYVYGDVVKASPSNGHRFMCTVGGTSGGSAPTWVITDGGTTTDGGVTWVEKGAESSPVTWTESGTSLITDRAVLLDLLPRFLGDYVQYGGISTLIASVPYKVFPAGTDIEECLKQIAADASSSTYNFTYAPWAASNTYNLGTVVEPTVVNGHTYIVIKVTGTQLSGGVQPTWPTTPGAEIQDNEVRWKENGLIGRFIINFPYQAGQVIQPSTQMGYYYTALNSGTSGPSDPGSLGWPTTVGNTVLTGSVRFVCSGATSVLPYWQLAIPEDNAAHNASWKSDFVWQDLNTISTLAASYTDERIWDATHIHWDSLKLTRMSSETANRVYVFGKNGAVGMAESIARQNYEMGHIRSIKIVDDTLEGNGQCFARAQNVLARLRTRESLQAVTKDLADPIAMRGLRKVKFHHSLFGLADPVGSDPPQNIYPLTDLVMTMPGGIASYAITAGDSFLGQTDDVTQATLGGREFAIDRTPPVAVRWITNPADPNYYLLSNTADTEGTATVKAQWLSGNEPDLSFFLMQASVNGVMRSLPDVIWPNQNVTLSGLPQNVDVYIYVVGVDRYGNLLHNPDGSIAFSISPKIITPVWVTPPPSSLGIDASRGDVPNGYHWVSEVQAQPFFIWNAPSTLPLYYLLSVWLTSDPTTKLTTRVSRTATNTIWPYVLNVGANYTASIVAFLGNHESTASTTTFTVPVWAGGTAPTIAGVTSGVSAGDYFLRIPVTHTGDHTNGVWVRVRSYPNGSDDLKWFPGNVPYTPHECVFKGRHVNVNYEITCYALDSLNRPTPLSAAYYYRIPSVPIYDLAKGGWDVDADDSVDSVAGWLPVAPATITDFAVDASVASFGGLSSLKATIPASTTKALLSYDLKITPFETVVVSGAAKRGSGTGTVPVATLVGQWFDQAGTTQQGSDVPIFSYSPTMSWPALTETRLTAPAGAYRLRLKVVGVGQSGASSYSLWFAFPGFVREVTNKQLGPGVVSSDKVGFIVGGGNLLQNASFEDLANYLSNWSASGGAVPSKSTSPVRTGLAALSIAAVTAGSDRFITQSVNAVPLRGKVVTFTGYVNPTSLGDALGNARLLLMFDGTTPVETTGWSSYPAGQFTRVSLQMTVGASASTLECRLYNGNTNTAVVWDDIQLELGDVPTAYASMGGEILGKQIQTAHLADLAVTPDKAYNVADSGSPIKNRGIDGTSRRQQYYSSGADLWVDTADPASPNTGTQVRDAIGVATQQNGVWSYSGITRSIGPFEVAEQSTPSTPASGYSDMYAKSDNNLYHLDDAGIETQLSFHQRKTFAWMDDFLNGATGSVFAGAQSGLGAQTADTATSATNRVGMVRSTTGGTSTGRAGYLTAPDIIRLGGGITVFEAEINLAALSAVAQEYIFRIGLIDDITADSTDGVYFEYDRLNSVNWRTCTASNGTRTKTNSSTAVATGWLALRIEVNAAASSVTYYVNGTSIGTNSANIPTGAGRELGIGWWIVKSAGTTASTVDVDYVMSQINFTTVR